MKNLILAFSFAFISFTSFAQTKTGTIDAEYILSQLPEMAEVNQGLETYNQELQKELENNITNYEKLVKDYQENSSTLTEEDKRNKESEIVSLENTIKNFRQRATVMIQMKRNELTKPMYKRIDDAMLQVVQEENYTQIFHLTGNSLAFSSEEYDITDEVMTKLGLEVQE